jgi:type IV pilus assembly protein PilC
LALQLEKTESLKKKIKKALYYPMAVVAVAVLVMAIMLIFVIPQFESMFKSFGASLPTYTLKVLALSDFVQKYWWLIVLVVVGVCYGFALTRRRSMAFRGFVDQLLLRLPLISAIIHKAVVARFARTLATTFSAGVPLVEALQTVAGASGNEVYRKAILKVQKEVEAGHALQQAMRQAGIFKPLVVQMVAIGEEAGALDDMLLKIAMIYEEEVDLAVAALSDMLEPAIMIILGVMVAALVIAMYLPIFKLASVV